MHGSQYPIWMAIVAAWTLTAAAQPATSPPGGDDPAAQIHGLRAGEIDALREGRGMGLARAADVHGSPGPRHVLDAARSGQLALRPDQQAAMERIFAHM